MRIVFVNSARGEGEATSTAIEICRGLAGREHEITIACHPRGYIAEQLAGDSRLTAVPLASGPALNPARVWQLARVIRRFEPDVVLVDEPEDLRLSFAARRLGRRFPIVHRQGAATRLKSNRLDRYLWGRELHTLIVNSDVMRNRIRESMPWLEELHIEVIPNGTDTTAYRPLPKLRHRMREELGIPDAAFVVCHHGWLQPKKHIDLLVRAVAELPRHLKVLALIVGAGPLLADTRRLAAELRAPVVFTGNRTDIPQLLSAADVAAHLSTAEDFSTSVIESLACGLPVVASDAACHLEQIEDGAHGVLVPPSSWKGVADALRWLASDREERERMSAAARERALKEFDSSRMIGRYEEILRQAVEGFKARWSSRAR